ncbi:hypothetical protein HOK51_03745 [Candidatus Woesearchaeota archaeon]|jgi:hypothetical protein|nr:hypothetical protein [Candidatus Woesearchaeota archaeon]MBT6518935.1 hypothetical protein [Candidatus Woesearchaeota archaeon]MBT7367603.1 hypothetical protein [Candidatus Woesearchaeota archaeon]
MSGQGEQRSELESILLDKLGSGELKIQDPKTYLDLPADFKFDSTAFRDAESMLDIITVLHNLCSIYHTKLGIVRSKLGELRPSLTLQGADYFSSSIYANCLDSIYKFEGKQKTNNILLDIEKKVPDIKNNIFSQNDLIKNILMDFINFNDFDYINGKREVQNVFEVDNRYFIFDQFHQFSKSFFKKNKRLNERLSALKNQKTYDQFLDKSKDLLRSIVKLSKSTEHSQPDLHKHLRDFFQPLENKIHNSKLTVEISNNYDQINNLNIPACIFKGELNSLSSLLYCLDPRMQLLVFSPKYNKTQNTMDPDSPNALAILFEAKDKSGNDYLVVEGVLANKKFNNLILENHSKEKLKSSPYYFVDQQITNFINSLNETRIENKQKQFTQALSTYQVQSLNEVGPIQYLNIASKIHSFWYGSGICKENNEWLGSDPKILNSHDSIFLEWQSNDLEELLKTANAPWDKTNFLQAFDDWDSVSKPQEYLSKVGGLWSQGKHDVVCVVPYGEKHKQLVKKKEVAKTGLAALGVSSIMALLFWGIASYLPGALVEQNGNNNLFNMHFFKADSSNVQINISKPESSAEYICTSAEVKDDKFICYGENKNSIYEVSTKRIQGGVQGPTIADNRLILTVGGSQKFIMLDNQEEHQFDDEFDEVNVQLEKLMGDVSQSISEPFKVLKEKSCHKYEIINNEFSCIFPKQVKFSEECNKSELSCITYGDVIAGNIKNYTPWETKFKFDLDKIENVYLVDCNKTLVEVLFKDKTKQRFYAEFEYDSLDLAKLLSKKEDVKYKLGDLIFALNNSFSKSEDCSEFNYSLGEVTCKGTREDFLGEKISRNYCFNLGSLDPEGTSVQYDADYNNWVLQLKHRVSEHLIFSFDEKGQADDLIKNLDAYRLAQISECTSKISGAFNQDDIFIHDNVYRYGDKLFENLDLDSCASFANIGNFNHLTICSLVDYLAWQPYTTNLSMQEIKKSDDLVKKRLDDFFDFLNKTDKNKSKHFFEILIRMGPDELEWDVLMSELGPFSKSEAKKIYSTVKNQVYYEIIDVDYIINKFEWLMKENDSLLENLTVVSKDDLQFLKIKAQDPYWANVLVDLLESNKSFPCIRTVDDRRLIVPKLEPYAIAKATLNTELNNDFKRIYSLNIENSKGCKLRCDVDLVKGSALCEAETVSEFVSIIEDDFSLDKLIDENSLKHKLARVILPDYVRAISLVGIKQNLKNFQLNQLLDELCVNSIFKIKGMPPDVVAKKILTPYTFQDQNHFILECIAECKKGLCNYKELNDIQFYIDTRFISELGNKLSDQGYSRDWDYSALVFSQKGMEPVWLKQFIPSNEKVPAGLSPHIYQRVILLGISPEKVNIFNSIFNQFVKLNELSENKLAVGAAVVSESPSIIAKYSSPEYYGTLVKLIRHVLSEKGSKALIFPSYPHHREFELDLDDPIVDYLYSRAAVCGQIKWKDIPVIKGLCNLDSYGLGVDNCICFSNPSTLSSDPIFFDSCYEFGCEIHFGACENYGCESLECSPDIKKQKLKCTSVGYPD